MRLVHQNRLAVVLALLLMTGLVTLSGCSRTQGQGQPGAQSGGTADPSSTAAPLTTTEQTAEVASADSLISNPFTGTTNATPQQTDPANGPRATFSETIYDAGTVEAGHEVVHKFKVKNTGKTDLTIQSVNPSCGCTVSDFTKTIPPGQEGTVTLTVKTESFRGEIQKTATVTSNDPINPNVTLTIKANVKPVIDIQPAAYISLEVDKGQPAQGKVTLINNDKQPLKILAVESQNPEFTAELKTVENGRRYDLIAKLNKTDAPGRYSTSVTVTTDNKKQEKVSIPVMVHIAARVEVSPERLVYGRINLESLDKNPRGAMLLNRTITVQSRDQGFKVTGAQSTLPFIQTEVINPAQSNLPYSVRITVARDKLPKGAFNGMVIVRTNDKEFSEFKIPVTGEVN
ncbi:MAG: DUF1573 domain-containing protein [Acidobacteriota bacterium]|nr:DUF1573 domain-containing protein [Blastocatellia bacterium]MDW8240829.1 DUF1573 domain-containing protein [Acidobacteriota bacterium]